MKKHGFTLIELLVVISVIVLLMALLVPALSRARKQARAVVCRSNLKQWGLHFATYASENEGRLLEWRLNSPKPAPDLPPPGPNQSWLWWGYFCAPDPLADTTTQKMRLCPMARTPATDVVGMEDYIGGTFLAWGRFFYKPDGLPDALPDTYSSYGLNSWHLAAYNSLAEQEPEKALRTTDVRGADRVPIMLDSALEFTGPVANELPPPHDGVPVASRDSNQWSCMNRHDGGVNGLFMDWSVRKVGLKELWTLKWHRQYDTAGPWTIAGGVQPSDWPEWMRGFKDY